MTYFQMVARKYGVPMFWIEEAGQDIAFRLWRRRKGTPLSVRDAAIDAARYYGPRFRDGTPKPVFVSLDALISVGWDVAA